MSEFVLAIFAILLYLFASTPRCYQRSASELSISILHYLQVLFGAIWIALTSCESFNISVWLSVDLVSHIALGGNGGDAVFVGQHYLSWALVGQGKLVYTILLGLIR